MNDNTNLINEARKMGAVPEGFDPVDIEFYQFKEPGDTLTGRLVAKNTIRMSGGTVGKYTMQVISEGKVHDVSFLGSTLLDEKLSRVPNGSNIYICYTGDESTGKTGLAMKHFTVAIKKSS